MAAPIDLRNDFDSVSLRRLAKRTRDATQPSPRPRTCRAMRCISITPTTGAGVVGLPRSCETTIPRSPFVIRKEGAEKDANTKRVWPQFKLPFGGKAL